MWWCFGAGWAPSGKSLRQVVGAVDLPTDFFRLTIEVGIGGRNEIVAGVLEGGVWRADGGFAKCGWWMEGGMEALCIVR
jgi:hypothetical protein